MPRTGVDGAGSIPRDDEIFKVFIQVVEFVLASESARGRTNVDSSRYSIFAVRFYNETNFVL